MSVPVADGLRTREITLADASTAAELSRELGYPVSAEAMRQRIEALLGSAGRTVYVACLEGTLVGWIDVGVVRHLQSEERAEIGGLVVSSAVRSRGIGQLLLRCAEQWALGQGLKSVVVRSQIAREAAHRFYLREGYIRSKTSAVFTKNFLPGSET